MRYRQPWIKRRTDTKKPTWLARLYDVETGELVKSRSIHADTKREAERMAQEWWLEMEQEAQNNPATYIPTPDVTVADYIESLITRREAFPIGRKGRLEQSTADTYRSTLRTHIANRFDGILIGDLTSDDIQQWVDELSARLAPGSVRKYFNALNASLNWAVKRDRILASNPASLVELQRDPRTVPSTISRQTLKKVNSALDLAEETPEMVGIKIAMLTGMREAEICCLTWDQVNLDERVLSVKEALGRINGGYYRKQPKSTRGTRSFKMPGSLIELLNRRRAFMIEECQKAGVPFTEHLYVIGGIDGSYMRPDHLSKTWRTFATVMGIRNTKGKRATFHELRHTAATVLINSGIDRATVAAILGDTVSTIDLFYIGIEPESIESAASALDQVMSER